MADSMNSSISMDTTNAKANIADLNRTIRVLESGFKAASAGLGDWTTSVDGNEARLKSLNGIMDAQKTKISNLTSEYEKIVSEQGASSRAAQDLEIKINKEKEALSKNELAAQQCSERLTTLGTEASAAGGGVQDVGNKAEAAAPKADKLKEAAGKLGEGLKTGLEVAAKAAAAAVAAVGTAAAAASKAAFDMAVGAGEAADSLLTTASQTGVSAEKLQGWSYAARFIDTDVSTMTGGMAKLTKKMGDAAGGSKESKKAFKDLGVSIKDSNGHLRDSEDVFADAITALGKIPDETKRDAMAMELFGKSAQELNPLIEAGGDALKQYSDEAKAMGLVMSDDALAAMGSFDDSMQKAQATMDAMKNSIGLAVIPAFQPLVDTATAAMGSVATALQDGLQPGELETLVTGLMDQLTGALTDVTGIIEQAIPIATEALNTIISTLADQLPGLIDTLLPAAMGLLQSLLDAIVTNIGPITDLAVSLVTQLGTFLAENAPKLLDAAISVITGLVDGLTDNLDKLIPIAIEMIVKLAVGLVEGIPKIIEKLPEIVAAIWDGLKNVDWGGLGLELIQGLVNGLGGAVSTLLSSIEDIFSGIWKAILGVFGIASPSKEASSMGGYIIQGLLDGLGAAVDAAVDAVKEIFGKIWDAIKSIFGFGGESNEAKDANNAGQSLMEGVTDGIRGGQDDLKTSLDSIVTDVLKGFREALGVTDDGTSWKTSFVGESAVKGIEDGMVKAATADTFRGAADAVGSAVSSAFRDALGVGGEGWFGGGDQVASKFKDIGSAIAKGIARGIEAGAKDIKDAAVKAANSALQAAKDALGIASPSKVARDQIGMMFGLGWAQGVERSARRVNAAVAGVAGGSALVGMSSTRNVTNTVNQYLSIGTVNGAQSNTIDYLSYTLAAHNKRQLAALGVTQ